MTTRKHNEFLDPVSDKDEGSEPGYDSEAAEETKVRDMKRRRTDPTLGIFNHGDYVDEEEADEGEVEGSDEEDEKISRSKGQGKSKSKGRISRDDNDNDNEENELPRDQYYDAAQPQQTKENLLKPKPLDKTKPPKKDKTGVIYFSSLPPYLRPFALKSLLETRGFTPITKVFLTPETRPASAPRRRSNKRKTYTDGWVEFASKKTAKICAETLNATIVGGKKGGWYHDDVWNMKYLRGFKWGDLMEQVQRERSEREAKRRVEDARARKEEKVFVSGVERGRVLDGMERKNLEKRKRKQEQQELPQGREDGEVGAGAGADVNVRRTFKQNEVKTPRDKIRADDDNAVLGEDTKRVLGKIF